jgi:hypothetical protein
MKALAIEDWKENSGWVTHYVYRDFSDGGSPDVIRGEIALFYQVILII